MIVIPLTVHWKQQEHLSGVVVKVSASRVGGQGSNHGQVIPVT